MNIINQQEIKVNERKRNQDLYSIFSTKNYQKSKSKYQILIKMLISGS